MSFVDNTPLKLSHIRYAVKASLPGQEENLFIEGGLFGVALYPYKPTLRGKHLKVLYTVDDTLLNKAKKVVTPITFMVRDALSLTSVFYVNDFGGRNYPFG